MALQELVRELAFKMTQDGPRRKPGEQDGPYVARVLAGIVLEAERQATTRLQALQTANDAALARTFYAFADKLPEPGPDGQPFRPVYRVKPSELRDFCKAFGVSEKDALALANGERATVDGRKRDGKRTLYLRANLGASQLGRPFHPNQTAEYHEDARMDAEAEVKDAKQGWIGRPKESYLAAIEETIIENWREPR
jgi:hypothetical protein